jgi:hypothetical protein
MTNWTALLDDFGRSLLHYLGIDPHYIPTDRNPITEALKSNPHLIEEIQDLAGFSRVAMCRVATICQMILFDAQRGPEGDGKAKALRRHWYAWFKTEFTQPLALQIGDFEINAQGIKEINDLAWTGRLSTTYAEFVDSGEVTYKDLWVEDASRMMRKQWEELFYRSNIVIAVEKDSLFGDFTAAANALGAKAVYSGKGKSSKAAIEKLLRDYFNWRDQDDGTFDARHPLIILHVSDYDFDGEAVIGPTFAEQARRYTQHILEARIGVQPEHVSAAGHALEDKWYQVKVSNKGYQSWAEHKALFLAQCIACPHQWPVLGTLDRSNGIYLPHTCPHCGGAAVEINLKSDTCHGFEVESLTTRNYYALMVDALLQVLPFEIIIDHLREECTANAWDAASRIIDRICQGNQSYQALLKEFDRLEEIKERFQREAKDALAEIGEDHIHDWRDEDEDPTPEDFRQYVQNATDYTSPWRPFSQNDRTNSLVEFLQQEAASLIDELTREQINW